MKGTNFVFVWKIVVRTVEVESVVIVLCTVLVTSEVLDTTFVTVDVAPDPDSTFPDSAGAYDCRRINVACSASNCSATGALPPSSAAAGARGGGRAAGGGPGGRRRASAV